MVSVFQDFKLILGAGEPVQNLWSTGKAKVKKIGGNETEQTKRVAK